MNNKRGFTLIELIITVAIVGILAMIAIPSYIGYYRRAERSEAFANIEVLRLLEEQFFSENNRYTTSLGICAPDQPGNVAQIQQGGGDPAEALPNFRPGVGLAFSYCILADMDIGGARPGCFRAEAHGNTTARVANEVYTIDCFNNTGT
jgi:prepilin-type N-terminal cleavage/methylation domain-containing protein